MLSKKQTHHSSNTKKRRLKLKMQKRQFRIGQLAKHLGIKRFVVRFWEKEFNLNANRSTGGQRFYGEKDLEQFQAIKKLLYEEGFTISGAKKKLKLDGTKIIASQKTTLEALPFDEEPFIESSKNKLKDLAPEKLKVLRVKLKELRSLL